MLVMRLREEAARVGGRIDPADETADVEGVGESAHRDAVAGPVLDGLHACLEVDAEGLGRRQ